MKIAMVFTGLCFSLLYGEIYSLNIENPKEVNKHILQLHKSIHFLNLEKQIQLIDDFYAFFNAYGKHIQALEFKGKLIFFLMDDGKKILYDDYREKNFLLKMSHPTLRDVLSQPYYFGPAKKEKRINYDPGRYRNYDLLGSIYGQTKSKVEDNLVIIEFLGKKVKFNKKNGAAKALQAVNDELKELIKSTPQYAWYFKNISGTYVYRKILGSENLSGHAYGIAIDLRLKKPYYWQNTPDEYEKGQPWERTLPREIVELFEKHHFIWGGKWYHYDRIHFEYRPEFFYKIR